MMIQLCRIRASISGNMPLLTTNVIRVHAIHRSVLAASGMRMALRSDIAKCFGKVDSRYLLLTTSLPLNRLALGLVPAHLSIISTGSSIVKMVTHTGLSSRCSPYHRFMAGLICTHR